MQYDIKEIEYVKAIVLSGFKADIQVQITIKLKEAIDAENIQVKLVSNLKGFNQIDKRWVDKYIEMWEIPINVSNLLKQYTGEILPLIQDPKDSIRTFANEFSETDQRTLLNWLNNNKSLIVSDILKGRGKSFLLNGCWLLKK